MILWMSASALFTTQVMKCVKTESIPYEEIIWLFIPTDEAENVPGVWM